MLNEVVTLIRNGFSCTQNSDKKGIPVSRIETISYGDFDFNKIGYTTDYRINIEDYKIRHGDILLSHINSIKHIGKTAIFHSDKTLYHAMNLMMIRPTKKVFPEYLHYVLSSAKAKRFFEGRAKPAINQASLNKRDIENYMFPLPPLKEQLKISNRINMIKNEIFLIEKKAKHIKNLRKGLSLLLTLLR